MESVNNTTTLLEEAQQIVANRATSYGEARDNMQNTADIWNVILKKKLSSPITAEDVPLMMVGFKMAREIHEHKRDNLVDIAGYADVGDRVHSTFPAKMNFTSSKS